MTKTRTSKLGRMQDRYCAKHRVYGRLDHGVVICPDCEAGKPPKPNLDYQAKASLLARWAKYNDPNNHEWDWDKRNLNSAKFEGHAIMAVLDLVEAERQLALAQTLPTSHQLTDIIRNVAQTHGATWNDQDRRYYFEAGTSVPSVVGYVFGALELLKQRGVPDTLAQTELTLAQSAQVLNDYQWEGRADWQVGGIANHQLRSPGGLGQSMVAYRDEVAIAIAEKLVRDGRASPPKK